MKKALLLAASTAFLASPSAWAQTAAEADAFVERALEFRRRDRDGFQVPQNVGEPQADETDVPLLQCPEHEFLLAIHVRETKQTALNLCYIVNSVSLRIALTWERTLVRFRQHTKSLPGGVRSTR